MGVLPLNPRKPGGCSRLAESLQRIYDDRVKTVGVPRLATRTTARTSQAGFPHWPVRPVHVNGRLYDPQLGRFLSADTVVQFPGNLQSNNRYSYVQNNPLTYNDPSGHVINFIIGAAVGVVVDVGAQMIANALDPKNPSELVRRSVAESSGTHLLEPPKVCSRRACEEETRGDLLENMVT